MSDKTQIMRHTTLPISAPRCYWTQAGYQIYHRPDDSSYVGQADGYHCDMDGILMLALAAGKTDADAVAWAIAEHQRRKEEDASVQAIRAEAASLAKLAAAIRDSGEDAVLERIMGRLTERTRYAVRAQLK